MTSQRTHPYECYLSPRDASTSARREQFQFVPGSPLQMFHTRHVLLYFSIDITLALIAHVHSSNVFTHIQRLSDGHKEPKDVRCAETKRAKRRERAGTNLPTIFPVIYHRAVLLLARSHIPRSCSHNGSSRLSRDWKNRGIDTSLYPSDSDLIYQRRKLCHSITPILPRVLSLSHRACNCSFFRCSIQNKITS